MPHTMDLLSSWNSGFSLVVCLLAPLATALAGLSVEEDLRLCAGEPFGVPSLCNTPYLNTLANPAEHTTQKHPYVETPVM